MSARSRFCCAVAIAASVTTRFAFATDYHWTVANGTWNNGPNWNPTGEPGGGDTGYIDLAPSATAHIIAEVPLCLDVFISHGDTLSVEHNLLSDGYLGTDNVFVGDSNTVTGTPGTLNVFGPNPLIKTGQGHVVTVNMYIGGSSIVGNGSTGTVNQSGGIVEVNNQLYIGSDPVAPSAYNFSGGFLNAGDTVVHDAIFPSNNVPCTFNISASGTVTLGALDIRAFGTVNQTGASVSVAPNGVGFQVAAGASYHLSGGTLISSQINIPGGSVSYDGGTLNTGSITLSSVGQLHLGSGGGKVLRSTKLSIGTVSGGAFDGGIDLNDNGMIVDYTGASPLALITSYIHGGTYDGVTNTARGIVSSAAIIGGGAKTLGYGEASAVGISNFGGYSVDSTTVIVRYTYPGDASLDGTVNALDFNALATNFGSVSRTWTQGDFNSDGITNMLDFNLLAKNFNHVLQAPALGSLVPEPLSAGAATALWIINRRPMRRLRDARVMAG